VVATQDEPIEPVDEFRTVVAIRRKGEILAKTPVARRHLGRREAMRLAGLCAGLVKKALECGPSRPVAGFERSLFHDLPAM
jgi:hypothetical protein